MKQQMTIAPPETQAGREAVVAQAENSKKTRNIALHGRSLVVDRAPNSIHVTIQDEIGTTAWSAYGLEQARWLRDALTTALEEDV